MAYVKRIVCLANSYKSPGGRCIAGREVLTEGFGAWIRPISDRTTAEVQSSEYRFEDGSSPQLLDILDIPLLKAVPHNHQTENHLIDPARRWVKRGEMKWEELEGLRERPESIWINRDRTSQGMFDCISQAEAALLQTSLLLIKKKEFTVEIGNNPYSGKKVFRADFRYKDVHYNFSLTDPVIRDTFDAKNEGEHLLENVYLCISLTEPYEKDGRCHKLVAAVMRNPR